MESQIQSLPVAGWYSDPLKRGSERWWDGTAWTDQTRMAAPTPIAPPVQQIATSVSTLPAQPQLVDPYYQIPSKPDSSSTQQLPSPAAKQPQEDKATAIAPIPMRFLAGIIDAFLIYILSGIVSIPVLLKYLEPMKKIVEKAMIPGADQKALAESLTGLISNQDNLILSGITFLTWFLYAGFLLATAGGATIGQRALGLRVLRADGKALGKNLAWFKSLLWGVLVIALGIPTLGILTIWNLLQILWSPRRQSLIDLVTQTLVVRR